MANNSPEIHKIDHIQSWMDKIKMENNIELKIPRKIVILFVNQFIYFLI